MIEEGVLAGLRKRYPDIHPLIFHRSVEKAKSGGELFDILETIPVNYPIIWSEEWRQWVTTSDIFQSQAYVDMKKKRD
jgi:hypothetical protein